MTNSQPRRPSAIRRRPQQPTAPSVEEFIHSSAESDSVLEAETPEPPPPSPPPLAAAPPPSFAPAHAMPPHPHHPVRRKQLVVFALFFAIAAFGLSLFAVYHTFTGKPFGAEAPPKNVTPIIASPQESPPLKVENSAISPPPPPTGIQGVQWLALTELQFARHDLLLGLNNAAMDSLTLAKIHLTMLGEPFSAEATALDRIISELQNTAVLSLEQLDSDIEALKDTWLQVTFGTSPTNEGLLNWMLSNRTQQRQEGRSELETTDIGRYLVARLDRLKWLALWGDERGVRQISASLENFLGEKFLNSPEAKNWLVWLRGLQRLLLRHDVTELNALIVRLSRVELPS